MNIKKVGDNQYFKIHENFLNYFVNDLLIALNKNVESCTLFYLLYVFLFLNIQTIIKNKFLSFSYASNTQFFC